MKKYIYIIALVLIALSLFLTSCASSEESAVIEEDAA